MTYRARLNRIVGYFPTRITWFAVSKPAPTVDSIRAKAQAHVAQHGYAGRAVFCGA